MTALVLLLSITAADDASACFSPATEIAAAYRDLLSVPASHDADTRYLTLYALPAASWSEAAAVVSFVLNSVSRAAVVIRPQTVPGSGGRLLRFSLADYGLPAEVWEAIVADDPYFHLQTKVVDPKTGRARTVYTDGGWLDLAAAAALRKLTASGGALLRADFFVARAATSNRGGFYYQLAGVPETEAEFYKLLGLDLKAINRLQADAGANLIRSGVTRKVRRVARRQGPLGGAWITYDVEQSTAERDPLRNPFAFDFDASEHIAAKANGLHIFALYNRQGQRQDSVPDKIAKDSSDPHGDGIIVPLVSCVRCHVEDGLRPFVSDQQRLLSGQADLFTEKPSDAQRLAAFYAANLEKLRRRDGEDYAEAVAKASDRTSPQIAAALASLYGDYVDALVTPEQAARELGVAPARLQHLLGASDDPVVLALLQGLAVQRDQWEAAFAQAALLTTGEQE
jgi:hypothetical protein